MGYYFTMVFNSTAQMSWWTKLGLIAASILAPYATLMYFLFFLVILDMATGIWGSFNERIRTEYKDKKLTFWHKCQIFWHNIESNKMRYTVSKLLCYMSLILAVAGFEFFVLPLSIQGYTITKIIAGLLCIIEIRSLAENLGKITNKSFYTAIFNIFKKKVEETVQITVPDDKTQYTTITEDATKTTHTESTSITSKTPSKDGTPTDSK